MLRDEMLKFWNEKDPQKARWLIVNANTWDAEIEPHVKLLLASDSKINDYICKLQVSAGHPKAIEIGCGIGRLMKPMTEFFDFVNGLDISETMIEQGKEYLEGTRTASHLVQEDNKFPFPNNHSDFIYSLMVSHIS